MMTRAVAMTANRVTIAIFIVPCFLNFFPSLGGESAHRELPSALLPDSDVSFEGERQHEQTEQQRKPVAERR